MPNNPGSKIEFPINDPFDTFSFGQAAEDVKTEVEKLGWIMEIDKKEGSRRGRSFVYDIKDENRKKVGRIIIENSSNIFSGTKSPTILFSEAAEIGTLTIEPVTDKSKIGSSTAETLKKWKQNLLK